MNSKYNKEDKNKIEMLDKGHYRKVNNYERIRFI